MSTKVVLADDPPCGHFSDAWKLDTIWTSIKDPTGSAPTPCVYAKAFPNMLSIDANAYFSYHFKGAPTDIAVRGYFYLTAPTQNAPYGQRKLFYAKTAASQAFAVLTTDAAFRDTGTSGKVNVNGTTVTLASGDRFAAGPVWNGKTIFINYAPYTVASVISDRQLVLTTPVALNAKAVPYIFSVGAMDLRIDAGDNSGDGAEHFTPRVQALVSFNTWHEVEMRAKLNTPGKADGAIDVFLDGKRIRELSSNKVKIRSAAHSSNWEVMEIGRQLDVAAVNETGDFLAGGNYPWVGQVTAAGNVVIWSNTPNSLEGMSGKFTTYNGAGLDWIGSRITIGTKDYAVTGWKSPQQITIDTDLGTLGPTDYIRIPREYRYWTRLAIAQDEIGCTDSGCIGR